MKGSQLCRHFQSGRCTFGDSCNFSHEDPNSARGRPMPYQREEPRIARPDFSQSSNGDSSLCRHFLQGKCTYGNDCSFSHGPPAPSPRDGGRGPSSICRHFLEGKCTYGDSCQFSHAAAAPRPTMAARPSIPAARPSIPAARPPMAYSPPPVVEPESSVCRHFLEGKCSYGDSCRFTHHVAVSRQPSFRALPPPVVEDPRSVCRHFLEGKCTYGDQCRFSHDAGPPPRMTPSYARSAGAPTRASSDNGVPKTRVCRHFLEGKCTYGDQCSFLHEAVERPEQQEELDLIMAELAEGGLEGFIEEEKVGTACRHFLAGKCTYGDDCRFSHTTGAVRGSQVDGRSRPY